MRQARSFPVAPGTLLGRPGRAAGRAGLAQAKGDLALATGTVLGASMRRRARFGLYITDALYEKYGGSDQFAASRSSS